MTKIVDEFKMEVGVVLFTVRELVGSLKLTRPQVLRMVRKSGPMVSGFLMRQVDHSLPTPTDTNS